jgi:hypothetical protein
MEEELAGEDTKRKTDHAQCKVRENFAYEELAGPHWRDK